MGSSFEALKIVNGISFSGYCQGPKLLLQLVIIAGILKVLCHDLTKWSLEAFEAE